MTMVPASAEAIGRAGEALRAGCLVAFPTETVYGLGADATNGEAVARIYNAKGRPSFNPLIVHVPDLAAAETIGVLGSVASTLAERFWPGPLTLVLRRRALIPISELVTAGLETIAVRVPAHPVALRLLAAAGVPVAAPSANRSGHVSPTLARHVADDLGDVPALILDAGPALHGLESTIVDVSGKTVSVLRTGALTCEAIEAALGRAINRDLEEAALPTAPGQLVSHYAPGVPLRLDATSVVAGEALLAFGREVPPHVGPMINLSASGDLVEAAANLFAALRHLDAMRPLAIAAMPIPEYGLGVAINDRLRRGAAPRGV